MQFEIYQLIVPLLGMVMITGLIRRFTLSKAGWQEALVGIAFWSGVIIFAIFPDTISNFIARLFGIKSNINAIIFFCLGLIFFFQYKLFFMIKQQESALTRLTRMLALKEETLRDKETHQ